MTMPKVGPISADRLRSFVERIERMEEERKAIAGDIRDIYSEAKGVGYDVKTLRKVVQLRNMDAADRDEQEQLLDVYLSALGMALEPAARAVMDGMSYGAAAAKFNVPKTSLHRVVPKSGGQAESGTPHDSATGNSAHEGEDDGRSNDGNAAVPEPQESLGAGDCDVFDGAECVEPNQRDGRSSGSQDDIRGQGLRANDGIAGCSVKALSATGRLPGDVRGRLPVDQPAEGVSGGVHEAVDLTPPPSLVAKRKEIEAGRAQG